MFISLGKATQQMTMELRGKITGDRQGSAWWKHHGACGLGKEQGLWLLQSGGLGEGGPSSAKVGQDESCCRSPWGEGAWAKAHVQMRYNSYFVGNWTEGEGSRHKADGLWCQS